MTVGVQYDLIAIAAVGGFILSFFNLWEDHQKAPAQRVEKDVIYWIFFAIWPFVGAFLCYIFMRANYNVDAMIALVIGLTTPTTIQSLISKSIPTRARAGNADQ